jgi:hypothetical protein
MHALDRNKKIDWLGGGGLYQMNIICGLVVYFTLEPAAESQITS